MRFKAIKLTENIKIHKPTSNWRCAYCKGEIKSKEICLALYDVVKLGDIFTQNGNGLKLHIGCIEDFGRDLRKLKEENIKEILAESL